MNPGKVYVCSELQKFVTKFLKFTKKIFLNPRPFLLVLSIVKKRKQIEPKLKVEKVDSSEPCLKHPKAYSLRYTHEMEIHLYL